MIKNLSNNHNLSGLQIHYFINNEYWKQGIWEIQSHLNFWNVSKIATFKFFKSILQIYLNHFSLFEWKIK